MKIPYNKEVIEDMFEEELIIHSALTDEYNLLVTMLNTCDELITDSEFQLGTFEVLLDMLEGKDDDIAGVIELCHTGK